MAEDVVREYMSVDAALAMCQVKLGDLVVLEWGELMVIDYFNHQFRCFMGSVMRDGETVTISVHYTKLIPKVREGVVCRELRVMSGAFPLVERGAVLGVR